MWKQFNFKQFSLALMHSLVLFYSLRGHYQVLPLRAWVDLEAMVIKRYSVFYKLQHYWSLTIRLFSVITRTLVGGGGLPLCRDAIGVFCSPNRLGQWALYIYIRGAFNKLPGFFVQAFKIAVDFWKFSISLLYIVWDDGLIFMISASNKQLQQQLEYTY